MTNVIYQSVKFDQKNVVSVYARLYTNGDVKFFDVDRKHKTIREWWEQSTKVDHPEKLIPGEVILYSGMTLEERKSNL
jgi:hypothetical protein